MPGAGEAKKKKAVPGARYGLCIERRKNGIGKLIRLATQTNPSSKTPSFNVPLKGRMINFNAGFVGILPSNSTPNKGNFGYLPKLPYSLLPNNVDKLLIVIPNAKLIAVISSPSNPPSLMKSHGYNSV